MIVLANALPLSQSDFEYQVGSERHSFLRDNRCTIWRKYEALLGKHLRRQLKKLERRKNVRVVHRCSLENYRQLWQGSPSVLVLLAHWSDWCVELFDGMVGADAIADAVPIGYRGVIDLGVCHPYPLVRLLVGSRPNCRKIHSRGQVHLAFWSGFYSALLRYVPDDPTPIEYLNTWEELMYSLIKTLHEGDVCRT